jgi:hypothetical protein
VRRQNQVHLEIGRSEQSGQTRGSAWSDSPSIERMVAAAAARRASRLVPRCLAPDSGLIFLLIKLYIRIV